MVHKLRDLFEITVGYAYLMTFESNIVKPERGAPRQQIMHYSAEPADSQVESINNCCTASDIIAIFNQTFALSERTILVAGGKEPVYYPAGAEENPGSFHKIIFANDFVSSALHEIAHWCIAGKSRRQLVDYGYWYVPDGRTHEQQKLFTQVEIKPQALEWQFSVVCRVKFQLSMDNINAEQAFTNSKLFDQFRRDVSAQALSYQQIGLPPRAEIFKKACLALFGELL